jgi:hypothetical protein
VEEVEQMRRESDAAQLNSRGFARRWGRMHSPPREELTRQASEVGRGDADNVLRGDDQTVSLRGSSNAGTTGDAVLISECRRAGGDADLVRKDVSKGA